MSAMSSCSCGDSSTRTGSMISSLGVVLCTAGGGGAGIFFVFCGLFFVVFVLASLASLVSVLSTLSCTTSIGEVMGVVFIFTVGGGGGGAFGLDGTIWCTLTSTRFCLSSSLLRLLTLFLILLINPWLFAFWLAVLI
uniref:Uncharacterized protein n=1 Tax=Cacopsylla melanoneura TaxID=428564 RepID=A0A8D9EPN8_9HEMI